MPPTGRRTAGRSPATSCGRRWASAPPAPSGCLPPWPPSHPPTAHRQASPSRSPPGWPWRPTPASGRRCPRSPPTAPSRTATMGRGGSLGLLVAVTLLALLVAPHAAPALQHGGVGGLLRHAPDLLPQLPKLGPPGRGAAGRPLAARRVVAYALAQRNKPYRWGHEGPDGFDCSGLAWAAWRSAGLAWPRLTADGQWRRGPRVHGRPRPGDLVFFHTRRMQ